MSNDQIALAEPSAAATIHMIAKAAADPTVDVAKLDRLLQMHERLLTKQAEVAFYAALSEMQQELPSIEERGQIKDNQGNVRSTYALWEDVNDTIKPILNKHGFALSFRIEDTDTKVKVTGVLSHKAGHREQTSLSLPSDTSGSKNSVQAVGSSVSYGKRYTAGALLNLTSHGEDDDGQGGESSAFLAWRDKLRECSTTAQLEAAGAELSKARLDTDEKKRLRDIYAEAKHSLESA